MSVFERDLAKGVAADISGVYVVGLRGRGNAGFVRKYDTSGALLWTRPSVGKHFGAAREVATDSTCIYVALDRGFVQKYDGDGNVLWRRELTVENASGPTPVISADSMGAYMAVHTKGIISPHTNRGGDDIYIRAYDPGGNQLWTSQFGTATDDLVHGISVGSTGV